MLALTALLPVGERLTYRVKYGPLTAGTLVLTVSDVEQVQGESCYRFESRLQTNPAYSALFAATYTMESYARVSDLVTLRDEKHTREPRYRADLSADFDYADRVVTYSDSTVVPLSGESRDLLSLWNYFRAVELVVGDEFCVTSHVDKRTYDVDVSVTGRERVETRAGTYDCLVVGMSSSGPAGNGTVYLSEDDQRLPVIIKTRLDFGNVTATLTSVKEE